MWSLLLCTAALPNPIDAWGPAIPPGVLAVNPNHEVRFDGGGAHQLVSTLGVVDRVDLNLAVTLDGLAVPNDVVLEALPRVFVAGQLALVLHTRVTMREPTLSVGPAIHSTWPIGQNLALYTDLGWQPIVSPEAGLGSGFVVAGAEVQIAPRIWPFLETNSTLESTALGPTPLVLLTPGLYVTFDEAGDSELCVGVRFPVVGAWEAGSVGLWFNQNLVLDRTEASDRHLGLLDSWHPATGSARSGYPGAQR